jgi:predicted  nucleic acid-binding Zn-ribbon protein
MTKQELSQLYYLNREIEQLKKRIAELESAATSITQSITGMPHVNGVSDKTGKYAAEIADLKELLELNLKKCFYELNRINRYINSVDDPLVRQIIMYRFVSGLGWSQIECHIGGNNNAESLRKKLYRFLKNN